MTQDAYWKLKAAVVQHQNAMMKLQALATQAQAIFDGVIREAGLDPMQHYIMHDDTQTVEVAVAPSPATE